MKLLVLFALALLAAVSHAFVPSPSISSSPLLSSAKKGLASRTAPSSSPLRPAGGLARPTSSRLRSTAEYWEGDWVCADCGYIYDEGECGGIKFEDQPKGFICPQCRGPRRRYAKKVGDKVGVTLDGGDGPILFWSFAGFAATIAAGVYFANQ